MFAQNNVSLNVCQNIESEGQRGIARKTCALFLRRKRRAMKYNCPTFRLKSHQNHQSASKTVVLLN